MMMGGWLAIIISITIIYLFISITSGVSNDKDDNPLSILNKRYASGEIDDEEYIRRKELIKGKK
ncbi:MAG: Short C-terminal domain [Haloplasmataceae bacterium]|jgi:putative membrane protein|nr:Short C-terminal domain [Haloplasmataceae bacterium]